jgi:hypothetical protein
MLASLAAKKDASSPGAKIKNFNSLTFYRKCV